MSMTILEAHDPLDKLKITIDFSTWLADHTSGAAVASAAWVVPAGLTEENDSTTASTAFNYFSGGVDGKEYEIACTITTDEAIPQNKTQRFTIPIET